MYVQFLLAGITVGSLYAMVGVGFSIIYYVTRVLNFAQGEFVMLGAMFAIFFASALHLPLPLSLLLAILIGFGIGVVFQVVFIRPLKKTEFFIIILITLAASLLFQGAAMVAWGKDALALPSLFGEKPIHIFGATILPQAVFILLVAFLVVVFLTLFLERNFYGKAMRACAEDRDAAELVGINVSAMVLLSFGLSAGLGALAGVLVVPITMMDFHGGGILGIKGIISAVFGGLDRVGGAVLGGVILGVIETFAGALVAPLLKDPIAFLILIMILTLRPSGLLGRAQT